MQRFHIHFYQNLSKPKCCRQLYRILDFFIFWNSYNSKRYCSIVAINVPFQYSDIDSFNVFSRRVKSPIDPRPGTIDEAASLFSLSPVSPVKALASVMARGGLPPISFCLCVISFFVLLSKGRNLIFIFIIEGNVLYSNNHIWHIFSSFYFIFQMKASKILNFDTDDWG